VKDGGMLLSVHVDDSLWTDKAKAILETTGARDVAVVGEVKTRDREDVPGLRTKPPSSDASRSDTSRTHHL
jgi:hypothetical protein